MNYRMKEIRTDKDLTQKQVAEKLNVNINTYKGWENESDNIPLREFNRFCELFSVSLDYVAKITKGREKITNTIKKEINPKIIGKNLEKIRKEKHLKQKEIAKIMGISEATYINYKNGTTCIQTGILKKFAVHYKISIDWIIGKSKKQTI